MRFLFGVFFSPISFVSFLYVLAQELEKIGNCGKQKKKDKELFASVEEIVPVVWRNATWNFNIRCKLIMALRYYVRYVFETVNIRRGGEIIVEMEMSFGLVSTRRDSVLETW